jgi:hypothetical protein
MLNHGPVTSSSQYWQEYTQGLESCVLGPLESTDELKEDLTGLVRLPSLDSAHRHDYGLSTIVACAWTQVLGFYCDSQEICFGFQDRRAKQALTTLCRMVIGPDILVNSLLDRLWHDFNQGAAYSVTNLDQLNEFDWLSRRTRLCNTAVVICDISLSASPFDVHNVCIPYTKTPIPAYA